MTRVTVWNEFLHEQENDAVRQIYPQGIHKTIQEALEKEGNMQVQCATLQEKEHGLSEQVLEKTDVLLWWGHAAHEQVEDAIVERVQKRVLGGMGLVVLHSGHFSKIFRRLMGSHCSLRWREAGEKERIWNVAPQHPITQGVGDFIELPNTEMYGERFDIPEPDELLFISWFAGGDVFRSGCCWRRGLGKIFYFRPGHETFPIYHNKQVQKVLCNAALWAGSTGFIAPANVADAVNVPEALEELPENEYTVQADLHKPHSVS